MTTHEIIITALNAVLDTTLYILKSYYWIMNARMVLYWFPNVNPYISPLYILTAVTTPYIESFEGAFPKLLGIDTSLLVAFIFLEWAIVTVGSIRFI